MTRTSRPDVTGMIGTGFGELSPNCLIILVCLEKDTPPFLGKHNYQPSQFAMTEAGLKWNVGIWA
jgi:hypothetical protein